MGRRRKFETIEDEIQSIDDEIAELETKIANLNSYKNEIIKKKEQSELNDFVYYIKQKNMSISDALSLIKTVDKYE